MDELDKLEELKKYITDNDLHRYRKLKFDVEADVYFLTEEEGGRKTPAIIGYRPNHLVRPDYLTSGVHAYLDQDFVFPGHRARTGITFITPEAYPQCFFEGIRINEQEASRLVGFATITKIYNEVLRAPHNKL